MRIACTLALLALLAASTSCNRDPSSSQTPLVAIPAAEDASTPRVVVAANVLERLAPIGVFRRLDVSLLPSRKNQDRERMPDAPIDSWRLAYDPKVVAKMADCGVSIADAPSEVIATVLMSLGKDPNDLSAAGLAEVERVLRTVRPSVRKIDGDAQINDLAGSNICLMVTWGTNVFLARARAKGAGQNPDLCYVMPLIDPSLRNDPALYPPPRRASSTQVVERPDAGTKSRGKQDLDRVSRC